MISCSLSVFSCLSCLCDSSCDVKQQTRLQHSLARLAEDFSAHSSIAAATAATSPRPLPPQQLCLVLRTVHNEVPPASAVRTVTVLANSPVGGTFDAPASPKYPLNRSQSYRRLQAQWRRSASGHRCALQGQIDFEGGQPMNLSYKLSVVKCIIDTMWHRFPRARL
jgi:hypothetical protein